MGRRLTVDDAALGALGDEVRAARRELDPPGTPWGPPGDLGADAVVDAVRRATAYHREVFRATRGTLSALADLTEATTSALAGVDVDLAGSVDGAR